MRSRIVKWLGLLIVASTTVSCGDNGRDDPSSDEDQESAFAQYDQILAEVRATPVTEPGVRGVYAIDVRNYGHARIAFWREVKQQWRRKNEDPQSLAKGWNEETPSGHAVGSHELDPQEEFQMTAVPAARTGVLLRFGVVFMCQDGHDFRKLVIWSKPVNPESARWNQEAEQGEDANAEQPPE